MLIGAYALGSILSIPLFYIFYKLWKLVILKVFVEKETEDTDITVSIISAFLSAITIAVGLILWDP